MEECAARAGDVLRAGGVVLYPTDTLYGLGADALSDEAVAKIYAIKGRAGQKPIHCIVADLEMAERYTELNGAARALAKKFLPGPLTLVLQKKRGIDTGIAKNMKTVAIRIPDNKFCLALARKFGKPYTTTSANVSGMEAPATVYGILEQLGEDKEEIDLVVDAGALPHRQASSVVDVSGSTLNVIREGAVEKGSILGVLRRTQ
ncbi:threonylcarbamoyl-AMP synthase [Candidatus Kaiserbacteria bacterium RIFCSPHIGHO2_01_FULL_55_17]|uniref:L-threonylcarbamoyladenylate synthase n=1 Tax=Candidatus Kaiserbacteria bacterium RIFCSPHIGHO2_01_FULL_55_17 TaxID=1798484 RepID=A0A1F6D9A2_9BACT|nr:MAG: threonylcarbamoyl-AMP synthase [Candidatus Kaiserbacteria bacterium RIFCSPHIGHO2_01_FULL_55_17]